MNIAQLDPGDVPSEAQLLHMTSSAELQPIQLLYLREQGADLGRRGFEQQGSLLISVASTRLGQLGRCFCCACRHSITQCPRVKGITCIDDYTMEDTI